MKTFIGFVILLALGSVTPIHSQTLEASPPTAAPNRTGVEVPAIPAGVSADPNSGHVFFAPTALMPKKGTLSFTSTQLVFVGMGYALSDNFLLSANIIFPLAPNDFFPYLVSAKWGVLQSGQLRIAVQGTLLGAILDNSDSFNSLGIGGQITYCFARDCHSYINGHVSTGFLLASEVNQNSLPLVFSLGLAQKFHQNAKFILELDSGAILGDYDAVADGLLAFYGIRLGSQKIAANVGLFKPISQDSLGDDIFPFGFPWIGLNYRTGP